MIPSRPSHTAQHVALRRAAHQLIDRPLILDDPLAIPIIGATLEAELRADLQSYETSSSVRYRRAFLVARSRFMEEHLHAALAAGVRQYLVLGAGLDTSAYRVPAQQPALRIFEVDFPTTQAWKRERLEAAGIRIPDGMTFAAIDFTEQTLAEGLLEVHFDFDAPTFVSWLGVTMYLEASVVLETLRVLSTLPSGSSVVFDYVRPHEKMNILHRFLRRRVMTRLARIGEPWLSAFDADALAVQLRTLGYSRIEDMDGKALNARYFTGRDDRLKVSSHGHVVAAFR